MRGRDRKDGDFQNTDYFLVKCVCVAHLLHLFPKMCFFFFCFIYKVLFFKEKSQKNWETIIHFFSSLIIFILLAQ